MCVVRILRMLCTSHAVPSATPTLLGLLSATPSTIALQWGAVECTHSNGPITGYSLRYTEVSSGREETVSVPGTIFTFTGLTSTTEYRVSVAAINSGGSGPYTESVTVSTTGEISKIFSSDII